jgi:DHA2 family multidrug resistance protein
MFVPLSTTAVGTLSNEQMGNASGLFNLLRNIGGSIGISVVDTMVARRQQVHRAELSRYIAPTAQVQQTLLRLQTYMSLHAGPRLAKLRAYALLENGLNQQSVLYAYVDDFRYMVLVCVLCLPIVFLLRPVKAKRGATPAGH